MTPQLLLQYSSSLRQHISPRCIQLKRGLNRDASVTIEWDKRLTVDWQDERATCGRWSGEEWLLIVPLDFGLGIDTRPRRLRLSHQQRKGVCLDAHALTSASSPKLGELFILAFPWSLLVMIMFHFAPAVLISGATDQSGDSCSKRREEIRFWLTLGLVWPLPFALLFSPARCVF